MLLTNDVVHEALPPLRSPDLLTSSKNSGNFTSISLLQADGSRIHTSASGGVGCLEPVGVVSELANNLCSMGILVQGGRECVNGVSMNLEHT